MNNGNSESLESWLWDAAGSIRGVASYCPEFEICYISRVYTNILPAIRHSVLHAKHDNGSRPQAWLSAG